MKDGRFSDAQIMAVLKQAEGIFETIEEAQDQATEWLWTYNNERLNMSIGGMTWGFARSGRKRSTGSFLDRPHPATKLKTAA